MERLTLDQLRTSAETGAVLKVTLRASAHALRATMNPYASPFKLCTAFDEATGGSCFLYH